LPTNCPASSLCSFLASLPKDKISSGRGLRGAEAPLFHGGGGIRVQVDSEAAEPHEAGIRVPRSSALF
jgi:hypothetical protein